MQSMPSQGWLDTSPCQQSEPAYCHRDCNETNPFLPLFNPIFLLNELALSFWLPYQLPLLSCDQKLQSGSAPNHMTQFYDQLLSSCQETVLIPTPQLTPNFSTFSSWPTLMLLSGDSPHFHSMTNSQLLYIQFHDPLFVSLLGVSLIKALSISWHSPELFTLFVTHYDY